MVVEWWGGGGGGGGGTVEERNSGRGLCRGHGEATRPSGVIKMKTFRGSRMRETNVDSDGTSTSGVANLRRGERHSLQAQTPSLRRKDTLLKVFI